MNKKCHLRCFSWYERYSNIAIFEDLKSILNRVTKKYLSFLLFLPFIWKSTFSQAMQYDPDLWLPDTIFMALGNTIELYNNNVAFVRHNDNTLSFVWSFTKGASDSEKYYWTTDQTGNFGVRVICKYNGLPVDTASTVVKVVDKIVLEDKNLLSVGNSLTEGGYKYQIPQILNDLDFNINPIGTRGTTYKHEGYLGWRFRTFLTDLSPFYFDNRINFKKYLETNNLPNPDIIRISLGINDSFGTVPIDTIFKHASRLIDTLRNGYYNSLIIIALPTSCEGTGTGWTASYGDLTNYEPYQLRLRSLWKKLYNAYSYGKYYPNIQVSFDGLFIDRVNGYPSDNGLHPNALGHSQLIRGFSNSLNYYVKRAFTGINDHEADENPFKLFPNPVHENVEIVFDNELPEKVFLYNLTGQLVLSQEVNDQRVQVNTSHLASGLYICTIKLGSRNYSRIISKL